MPKRIMNSSRTYQNLSSLTYLYRFEDDWAGEKIEEKHRQTKPNQSAQWLNTNRINEMKPSGRTINKSE